LIHANPTVLFDNNIILGIFIKNFIHFLLLTVIQHKCPFFNINFNLKKYTIPDLITFLSPYITVLRIQCNKCYSYTSHINVAEIAHLLVLNKQNQWNLAIDLNVYSRNQPFRLFDCTKRCQNNFLLHSTYFQFNNHSDISYFEISEKSIITYNSKFSSLSILYLDNNQFKLKLNDSNNSLSISESTLIILNNISETFITNDSRSF